MTLKDKKLFIRLSLAWEKVILNIPCVSMCTIVLPITKIRARDKQDIHASSKREFSARRWTIFNFPLDLALAGVLRETPHATFSTEN